MIRHRLLVLTVCGGLAASPESFASTARLGALAEHPLVADELDVIDFPGLLGEHGNQARLEISTVADGSVDGSLVALFGHEVVLGAWIHRPDEWRDLDKYETLFATDEVLGEDGLLPPIQDIADLFLGFGNGFGVRVTTAAGLRSTEVYDREGALVSTGATAFAIGAQLGYSLRLDGYHADFGAGLSFSPFWVEREGARLYDGGTVPSWLVRHRSVLGPRRDLAAVVDLSLSRRAYTITAAGSTEYPAEDGGFGRWLFDLTVGPRLALPFEATAWLGLGLAVEHLAGRIAGTTQPTLIGLSLPCAAGALEAPLHDLIVLRVGARYELAYATALLPRSDEPALGLAGAPAGEQELGQAFTWSTGLGLTLAAFRVDATVEQSLLLDGPDFIGGREPGLFGRLSAGAMW